jgi:hypothetical protein
MPAPAGQQVVHRQGQGQEREEKDMGTEDHGEAYGEKSISAG